MNHENEEGEGEGEEHHFSPILLLLSVDVQHDTECLCQKLALREECWNGNLSETWSKKIKLD